MNETRKCIVYWCSETKSETVFYFLTILLWGQKRIAILYGGFTHGLLKYTARLSIFYFYIYSFTTTNTSENMST